MEKQRIAVDEEEALLVGILEEEFAATGSGKISMLEMEAIAFYE